MKTLPINKEAIMARQSFKKLLKYEDSKLRKEVSHNEEAAEEVAKHFHSFKPEQKYFLLPEIRNHPHLINKLLHSHLGFWRQLSRFIQAFPIIGTIVRFIFRLRKPLDRIFFEKETRSLEEIYDLRTSFHLSEVFPDQAFDSLSKLTPIPPRQASMQNSEVYSETEEEDSLDATPEYYRNKVALSTPKPKPLNFDTSH